MEVLLIDIGALAIFFAYVALVYWHGVASQPQLPERQHYPRGTSRASHAHLSSAAGRES